MRTFLKDKKTLRVCRIYRMLRENAKRRHLSFHTPGHKRGKWDVTELSFSDNLASPTGCIALAQEEIASLLGANGSFLLTDGSTSGVLSMLHAARALGVKRVAAPVLSHKSFLNGCKLLSLTPVWFPTRTLGGVPLPTAVSDFSSSLNEADALFLTSPDYYGNIPDLQRIRDICRENGKLLLIDGAHGGHLRFERTLYAGAYADLWVDGVHKSLPAFTQGAVVSARTEAGVKALAEAVDIFRTTSPSYPVMASVEYAVKYPRNERLERAATELALSLKNARFGGDWTKLCVQTPRADGVKAALEKRGIYPEFSDGNVICFYLSPATKIREFKTLKRILKRLEKQTALERGTEVERVHAPLVLTEEQQNKGVEEIDLARTEGRICAKACGLFPPCLPLLFVGERIGKEKVERLLKAEQTFGLNGNKITVVKE